MMTDQGKDPQKGKRPGQEAKHAEEDSRRKAAETNEQDRRHLQVDALDKGERCVRSDARQQTQMAKLPRTALNETPSQTGTVPRVIPQKTPTPKVMASESGKDEEERSREAATPSKTP